MKSTPKVMDTTFRAPTDAAANAAVQTRPTSSVRTAAKMAVGTESQVQEPDHQHQGEYPGKPHVPSEPEHLLVVQGGISCNSNAYARSGTRDSSRTAARIVSTESPAANKLLKSSTGSVIHDLPCAGVESGSLEHEVLPMRSRPDIRQTRGWLPDSHGRAPQPIAWRWPRRCWLAPARVKLDQPGQVGDAGVARQIGDERL